MEGCHEGKFFFRKTTSGGITEEKSYATNAFLWGKFKSFMFLYSISNFSTEIQMKYIRNEFSAKDHHQCFSNGKNSAPFAFIFEKHLFCRF
jgi:hypothetical protein